MMKMNKIIIFDYGLLLHTAGHGSAKNPVAINYTIWTMIIGALKIIGINPEDEIIIACDGRNSWRKMNIVSIL